MLSPEELNTAIKQIKDQIYEVKRQIEKATDHKEKAGFNAG